MAAPTYVDGDVQYSLTAKSVSLTIPAGASEGDLILVFVKQSLNANAELWDDDGGGGNGYTLYEQHRSTGGRDQETAIYWKIHGSSESDPTFTWSSTGADCPITGIMLIYSGVDSVQPIEDLQWMWNQNDCNPPNPEVTTTKANNRVVVFHAATHDDISSVGAPSGYTIREYQYGGSSGHNQDHADSFSADAEIDTIGSYTPGDWTHGASNTTPEYHTYTVVLREPLNIHVTDVNGDEVLQLSETGCTVTGDGFETSQGTGKIELWDDTSGTTKQAQTVTSWASDTALTFTCVQGSLDEGWNYLVVTNDSGDVAMMQVWLGDPPWNPAVSTDADLYWRMDGGYGDEGNAGDNKPFNAVQRGNYSFASVPITISNGQSFYIEDSSGGSEPANSDYTNITNTHTYRDIGGFVRIEAYQKTPAVIYEEGGGVNNIYFLMNPNGWLVANVADSGGSPDFKYECYSDFALITGRPYHILIHAQFGDHFQMYIDGELQLTEGGGALGSDVTMSTHSGDWSFGDPGANLDTGGVDISYDACNPMYMAHWGTWSGAGGGAPLTATQIKNELFRDGALEEHTIGTGTESAMQTAMEAYDSQTHKDWPLTFEVMPKTGGGDLELTLTDQVWPDECKFHIRWMSEVGTDDLTIRNSGTSNFSVDKAYSKDGGSITVIETATLKITVKDITDNSVMVGAMVFVEAGATGPLTEGDDIIKDVTNGSGEIEAEIDYTTDQSIIGYVRSASSSTKYKQSDIVSVIGASGVELTIFLVRDE